MYDCSSYFSDDTGGGFDVFHTGMRDEFEGLMNMPGDTSPVDTGEDEEL